MYDLDRIDITIIIDGSREYRSKFENSDPVTVVRHIAMRALGIPSNLFYRYELCLGSTVLDEHKTLKELELPDRVTLFLKAKD